MIEAIFRLLTTPAKISAGELHRLRLHYGLGGQGLSGT
jgi:hypothetical protein